MILLQHLLVISYCIGIVVAYSANVVQNKGSDEYDDYEEKDEFNEATKRQANNACPTKSDVITTKDVQDAVYASSLAYDDDKLVVGAKVPNTNFKITLIKEEKIFDDGAGFLVFLAEKGSTTMVTFRGTDTNKQLKRQIYATIKDMDGAKWKIMGKEVKINQFFLNAVKLLLPSIKYKLKDQSRRYILTGHSLGGAMASLLAIIMAEDGNAIWKNPKSALITFGQPRVGNSDYATLHDKHINTYKKLRFINRKDAVPHIPLWPWFRHHSREVLLDYETKWSWFKRTKKNYWRVCNAQEQYGCSNSYILMSFDDHAIAQYVKKVTVMPDHFKKRDKTKVSTFEKSILGSCNLPEKRSLDDEMADNQMYPHTVKDSVMMDHKPSTSFEESMEMFRKIHKLH